MPNQNNVIPYQYNIKFFRVLLRNRHPGKLHNLYLSFTKKARTQSTSIFTEGVSNSALCQPAQQAFPCGLGAKNEERESKTTRKMAQVKERGGGGEERKVLPSPPPPPTFIFWLLFHFSRGQNRESRSPVFLCSETKRKLLLRRLALCRSQKFDNLLSALRHFR